MTNDEIDVLIGGRELDLMIHRVVMHGEERCASDLLDGYPIGLPHYSTQIQDAWKIVEALQDKYCVSLHTFSKATGYPPFRYECHIYQFGHAELISISASESMPDAVCKASLKALNHVQNLSPQ